MNNKASTKQCPKCGCTDLVLYHSNDKKRCADCHHLFDWRLNENQAPIFRRNNSEVKKPEALKILTLDDEVLGEVGRESHVGEHRYNSGDIVLVVNGHVTIDLGVVLEGGRVWSEAGDVDLKCEGGQIGLIKSHTDIINGEKYTELGFKYEI